MTVEWRDVPAAAGLIPGYMASSGGHVRLHTGVETFGSPNMQGYMQASVRLAAGGWTVMHAHRLVALAFHGMPPEGKPFACHYDGVRSSNTPSNIRWASQVENMADRKRHGTSNRGNRNGMSKLTERAVLDAVRLRSDGVRAVTIASSLGVSVHAVHNLLTGRTWGWLTGLKRSRIVEGCGRL